jgi:hypothetical protein
MEGTMVTVYGWFAAVATCAAVLSYEIDVMLKLLQR